jgi:hypothetical protein
MFADCGKISIIHQQIQKLWEINGNKDVITFENRVAKSGQICYNDSK